MGAFIFFICNFHSDPIFNILPSFRMYWAKYPYLKKWIFKITLFCSWMRFLFGEWLMTMLFSFSYSVFSHCRFQFWDESICHCLYFTSTCSLSNFIGEIIKIPFISMGGYSFEGHFPSFCNFFQHVSHNQFTYGWMRYPMSWSIIESNIIFCS